MIVAQQGLASSYNGSSVAAWKASKFSGGGSRFPTTGQTAPSNPDVTGSVAGGAFSLSTPTNEDYWWAIYDAQNKITFHALARFEPPRYQAPTILSGPGAPASGMGLPDGSVWVRTDNGGAGARIYVSYGGTWTATAA